VDTSSLTTEECRAIEVLLEDWKDLLRCTAIHQAMERAGLPFSPPSRLRVAEFLIAGATASGLMRWAPSTYVLTNDEKLVARHALRLWHQGKPNPQPSEDEWLRSGWKADRIEVAFDAMSWLGFMRKVNGRYELADNAESFPKGLGSTSTRWC
jgi:hypothetical protein